MSAQKIQRNKYRTLKIGEVIQKGDYANSKANIKLRGNLNTAGWVLTVCYGMVVDENNLCIYYRLKEEKKEEAKS